MPYWFAGQWFEQDFIQIPVDDPALLYGATVFTTLRVYAQDLYHPLSHWPDHGDRLRAGLQTLQWPVPDWREVERAARTLGEQYPVLRLTCFLSGQALIIGRHLPVDLEQKQTLGINAWLMAPNTYQRSLPTFKTGNYLAPWLAQDRAKKNNAQEAILTDKAGHWLETATGNLWGWRRGQFFSPPLDGQQLAGIAHGRLCQWLAQKNLPLSSTPWSEQLVCSLEGIAYSNSVVELISINTVLKEGQETFRFPLPQAPEYQLLRDYFRQDSPVG